MSPALAGTLAVLRLLPQVDARRTAVLAAATLLSAALPVAIAIAMGLLVGSMPAAVQGGLDSPAGRDALATFGVVCLLAVGARALGPLQSALASTFARDVDRHLQERVMAAVGRPSGIKHLEDTETLDLIKNAQGVGTEGLLPGHAVTALASLIPSWLQALGAAAILVAFNPWLGLVWIAMWPLILGVLMREFIRAGQAAGYTASSARRASYFLDLALMPAAGKELRIWGLRDWLIERFQDTWLQAMRPVWRTRNPGRPVIWLTTAVLVATNLGAYVLLAYAALAGDITLAALVVYLRAIQDASGFRAFDDPNAHLAYAAVALPSLLELERRLAPPPAAAAYVVPHPEAPRRGISFERITFRYPTQTAPVLTGFDLDIPAGRSLAVVGANGAGKTTLIKLLCGLYEPDAGRILVDGTDLRHVEPADWQRRVGAIFQDFVQYHLTVRENVGLGAPAHADDLDRLRAAAARAGALELIEALPRGWDTVLSRRYSGGVDLSGGQWQRIALARALFAVEGGARVLILDEPTAALDVRAEAALYDRFLELTAGLTTVLISHRFSTVRRADRIVVLQGGRVTEQGTHEQLVAAGGEYGRMFALQAARFAEDEPGGAGVGVPDGLGGDGAAVPTPERDAQGAGR
ncbi:MAG TPA: ABC transporter ATP-binding protein [Chloroflexota bacterium]|nr:ABC transporter ATP-binding protein [Chloroflexota bacterium]